MNKFQFLRSASHGDMISLQFTIDLSSLEKTDWKALLRDGFRRSHIKAVLAPFGVWNDAEISALSRDQIESHFDLMCDRASAFIAEWRDQFPAMDVGALQSQLAEEVGREVAMFAKHGGGSCEPLAAQRKRGNQVFAAYKEESNCWYELKNSLVIDLEKNRAFAWVPAMHEGSPWMSMPDEGRSGITHFFCMVGGKGKAEWMPAFSSSGFIYRDELEMSDREIVERISDEVDAGMTPITGLSGRPEYQ